MSHPALKWAIHNLAFPLGTALLSGIFSALYMMGELSAGDYASQRNAMRQADREYRHLVGQALEDGKITRWENAELQQQFWQHAHALVIDPQEPGTQAAEREALAKEANVILPD
ncbi:hypothetical protein ACU4GI_33470 [Cupriavidus basilensis]